VCQSGRFIPGPGENPAPGLISPPVSHTPVCPCPGWVAGGPPRVRGWAMGGGAGGWVLVLWAEAHHPASSPSWWPVAVAGVVVPSWCRAQPARQRPDAAGAGACGAIRAQHAGSPSRGCRPSSAQPWPGDAAPGAGQWWPARGSGPRWWAGRGIGRGRFVARTRRQGPAVRALLSPARVVRGGRRRVCSAHAVAQCVWGSLPRAQSPPHTAARRSPGASPRRRGGLRRGRVPVHSEPPA